MNAQESEAITASAVIDPENEGRMFDTIQSKADEFRTRMGTSEEQRSRESSLRIRLGNAVNGAQEIQIINKEDEQSAADFLTELTDMKKNIEIEFEPTCSAAFAVHKESTALRGKFLNPVLEAISEVKIKMKDFRTRERKKLEEQERIRVAAAKKQAEEEAMRIAEKAEEQGLPEVAAEFVEEAIATAPQVVVPPKAVAPSGVGYRKVWDIEMADHSAFYKYLAENPDLGISFAPPQLAAIKRHYAATKGAMKIPGIRAELNEDPTARSKRKA